jgi:hypothetical protein
MVMVNIKRGEAISCFRGSIFLKNEKQKRGV